MEHAQRVITISTETMEDTTVLILILMEHAQREYTELANKMVMQVLILILMEHAQRERRTHCYLERRMVS